MFRSRSKSSQTDNKNNNGQLRRTPSNPDFNPQSFKDIETLFGHGDRNKFSDLERVQEQPSPSSSCSPESASSTTTTTTGASAGDVKRHPIFHRIHLASRSTRAFSARPKPDLEEIISPLNNARPATETPAKSEKPLQSVKSIEPFKSMEPVKSMGPVKSLSPLKSEKASTPITIPGAEKRVVVYMTSLRCVRSTFEACRTVRSIIQGFRVPIDERDLSMDASFLHEIHKIMAQMGQAGDDDRKVALPKVFIGGRYIGGADEVVELHEIGELKKFVAGLPAVTPGVCDICGGFRFILCDECDGSHKCHLEDGGFTTCIVCNENGLIRCPSCLSS